MSDGLPLLRACLAETRALRRAGVAPARRPVKRRVREPSSKALLAAGGLLVLIGLPSTAQALTAAPTAVGEARSVQTQPASAGLGADLAGRTQAQPVLGGPPVRVRVPAVDLDVPVVGLGLRADGSMEVPRSADTAAWYEGGPLPGEPGAALLVAHFDSTDGPAAFYDLREVMPGARVTVRDARGGSVEFVVDRISEHPKDNFPTEEVFGGVRRPELRLITCSGSFNRLTRHYSHNLVVSAHLAAGGSA